MKKQHSHSLNIDGLCVLHQKAMAATWANLHKSISLTLFSHSCGLDCKLWHNAGHACTNVLRVLAEGLGVTILRTCANNGNNILWGGVCGWMDGWMAGVQLEYRVADHRHWRPFGLSLEGGGDEGHAPSGNYTLASASQLRKIMENLSQQR